MLHPYNREHGEMSEHPKCTSCNGLRYPEQQGLIIQGKYICGICYYDKDFSITFDGLFSMEGL